MSTDAEKVQAWVREHRPSEGFGFSVAAWSDLLDLFTAARADESERVAAVAEERDAALAEVRDLLDVHDTNRELLSRVEAAEAKVAAVEWPISLHETQQIVGHLMTQGTREGLILSDLLNKKMGASARRRAATTGDHPPCCTSCSSAQGACSDCLNTGHPHP